MIKVLAISASFFVISGTVRAEDYTVPVQVNTVQNGYVVKKIWLKNFSQPEVSLTDIAYVKANKPDSINCGSTSDYTVTIGMERKRPFAVISVPAYSVDPAGGHKLISSFTVQVKEPTNTTNGLAAKTTSASSSVLASGTWYKLAVPATGLYKIDAAFITSMGLNPATVNPNNVRIYGNGGRMLPEANYKPRQDDLTENAVLAYDNGDNVFNSGDYVIFYGMGPTGWDANNATKRFNHLKNLYSDTAYYFITFDKGASTKVTEENGTGAGNVNVTDYNWYAVYEKDDVNPGGIGKNWYGETFSSLSGNLTQTFNFDVGALNGPANITAAVGSRGSGGSKFMISANGGTTNTIDFPGSTSDGLVMIIKSVNWDATINNGLVSVSLNYNPSSTASMGYLDYIEVNGRRPLTVMGAQTSFRDLNSVNAGNIAQYTVQSVTGNARIWDVTNPYQPVLVTANISGSSLSFARDASQLREYVVMNGTDLLMPQYAGTVANQNLHGLGQTDNIIVTNKQFKEQADRLAAYHSANDKMRVVVVTPEEIYNEFSSGAQDISAIRDFVRMFYKRAGSDTTQMPKYLTLLGSGSYDYKNRIANNSNYVPVFESKESAYKLNSFSTDDFYGFLDDNENIEEVSLYNTLDIGVGRLPARSVADAKNMVDKVLSYKTPETLGPWRLASTLIADNADGAGNHMQDAEVMGSVITNTTHNLYNHSKVYLDAIPSISTPAGHRAPIANASIADRVFKGTLMMNYSGHGNPQVWADERILTKDDFNKWNNSKTLPFMVTATCDFGQFDQPQFVSAAEQLALRKDGGVIAILTTTASVYAHYNRPLNALFLESQLRQNENGSWNSFGDATRIGKNATYSISKDPNELANYRKFALLGDPALTANFPEHFVKVDSIMDVHDGAKADTIKALGAYKISGHVHDASGNKMTGFNGILTVSFYDKPKVVSTITSLNAKFDLQDNLVYKGKVSVTNGAFSYTFIAPKDINYYYGSAKISHYAHNGVTDAAGVDTNIAVGGYSDNPVISTEPPVVQPYINDSMFQNGGITGSNTSLYVVLKSETGINVSGNKLGHDLTAVLDDNIEQPYILNDFYETAPNTYQLGYVTFPISGIANGKHTLKVQAWDVNNNVGEGSVDFVVIDGKIMAIENLMNYPNPFGNDTRFVFEHNHPDVTMDVEIAVSNLSGAIVRTIKETFTPTGSRTAEISWDGTDNNGIRLPSGMYVYRLSIATQTGYKSTAYQKLVIAR